MNKYLEKIAKKATEVVEEEDVRPHQQAALDKLDKNKGLIIHHSTGSGKSKVMLLAAKKALDEEKDKSKKALIIAPASLVSNVDKELTKHKIKLDRKRLIVKSYEKAVNDADELAKHKYAISIADEAQKLRNTNTKRTRTLADILSGADKRLLATATANYNRPSDIAPLVNIAAGKRVLPDDPADFNNRYIAKLTKDPGLWGRILGRQGEEYEDLKNKDELRKAFKKHVHYYDSKEDPSASSKFPKVSEKTIDVEMSPDQEKYYAYMENKLPLWLRIKVRHNLPMDKAEKTQLNSFSTGVRQVSTGYRHLTTDRESASFTPKVEEAVRRLEEKHKEDKNFRGVVYSNYLDAGLHEYSKALEKKGIKHVLFTGAMSKADKDAAVKDYNSGKIKALLVSSSGAEGLDLKGTKLLQVMEPHFNPSKIRQVVGRGARYESHEHLPENERTMEVQHFRSVHPKPKVGKAAYSIDRYLSENSDTKQEIFDKIKDVMKEAQ